MIDIFSDDIPEVDFESDGRAIQLGGRRVSALDLMIMGVIRNLSHAKQMGEIFRSGEVKSNRPIDED
jgi:hypothetical protein